MALYLLEESAAAEIEGLFAPERRAPCVSCLLFFFLGRFRQVVVETKVLEVWKGFVLKNNFRFVIVCEA